MGGKIQICLNAAVLPGQTGGAITFIKTKSSMTSAAAFCKFLKKNKKYNGEG